MTRLTQNQISNQNYSENDHKNSHDDENLYLKRLLVTLKQQYEKSLFALQDKLKHENEEKLALQNSLNKTHQELQENQRHHEEELQAIMLQQVSLKELLKQAQNEAKFLRSNSSQTNPTHASQELAISQQRIDQLQAELSANQKNYENSLNEMQKRLLERQSDSYGDTQQKDNALDIQQLEEKIKDLQFHYEEKIEMQERYEQLKDEWKAINDQLEATLDIRLKIEEKYEQLLQHSKEQEAALYEYSRQHTELNQEKEKSSYEIQQMRELLNYSEEQLKIAQQHLAKKVKESSLFNEQVNDLQAHLNDTTQQLESARVQIGHLHTNIELYQRQEKKLQEQLHDALKSTESQVSKWEEKYFKMYDKWQESELKNRELKKFEEKHLQMQSLLANLGNFVGANPASFFQTQVDAVDRPHVKQPYIEYPEEAQTKLQNEKNENFVEEKFDLFGMKYTQDKNNSNNFS